MSFLILVVNPGSTSTKAALFRDRDMLEESSLSHDPEELKACGSLAGQLGLRINAVLFLLNQEGIPLGTVDAVIGRGGLMKPLPSGVYEISREMMEDMSENRYGTHASNLGALMARQLAEAFGKRDCPALIADPVVVDELIPEARITGLPAIKRRSIFHALNQKSVARQAAEILGGQYEELNFIVAHMGGGISVGAHRQGRVIDVNNALDGEGPFSPERSGTLPAGQLLDRVEAGVALTELRRSLTGEGGLAALTGTKDLRVFLEQVQGGDGKAAVVYKALVLRVSQEICRHGATLEGRIDRIILTGGLAKSTRFTEDLKKRVSFLAEVLVIPGEREMQALAENALAVLKGERKICRYEVQGVG
ncbi:butyrate kinase [Oceanispirochaeta sp.]|jgi:butyrate kinase|uniref:butyrate kinase n=1 Tax=Oceanispirochaeta sp. TaxID=2035350 RepID=UPI002614352B|nr:butyrate kinase [Oceanispirochaeta sp.]MDA3955239.1 butyrate kinase [Oceanispirochaeta sp.]